MIVAPSVISPENPELDRRITKKNILKKIHKALKKVGANFLFFAKITLFWIGSAKSPINGPNDLKEPPK